MVPLYGWGSTASRLEQLRGEGPGTSFQAKFSTEFFDKKFCFVILHKLAKCHYQTVFTSQVIQ